MNDVTDKTTEWWRYVELIMRLEDINPRILAQKLDIAGTTPSQWKLEGRMPRPEVAVKFAEVFRRPVPEVFVKAKIATAEQLNYTAPPLPDGSHLSNAELLATLASRLIPDDDDVEQSRRRGGTAVKQAKKASAPKKTPASRRAPR